MSENHLLEAFASALGESDSKSTFACGGTIPIILNTSSPSEHTSSIMPTQVFNQTVRTKPVTIRYGPLGHGQTLSLPTETTKDPAFLNLISTCEPASFGREGKDVFDEQYRKATKLDTTEFCSSFCPYETGIIDVVTQLLMPSAKHEIAKRPAHGPEVLSVQLAEDVRALFVATENYTGVDTMTLTKIITSRSNEDLLTIMRAYEQRYQRELGRVLQQKLQRDDMFMLDILAQVLIEDRAKQHEIERKIKSTTGMGIRAELYKLNVYSGPSGRFRAHVDTPRSETQIGSLVVCLPSEFEGGVLSVSHQGNTVQFDWSASSPGGQQPSIQWAAFYSDCSHEIQEVTAGHRITLTYNLYASRGSGLLAGTKHSLDAIHLPIYRPLMNLLGSRSFMPSGGRMAIGLAHAYPYTHSTLHRSMPEALKGADMMLYEALLASGLGFELIRIMDFSDELDNFEEYSDGKDMDDSEKDPFEKNVFYRSGFEPMQVLDSMIERSDINQGLPGWTRLGHVKWIRRPRDLQLEMAYLAYGNEATMTTKYSSAAIIVNVPSLQHRLQVLDG
ncbi:hypothetical protein D6C85_01435 [Aureobasidium pullulans]|uniref:Fe2OG dioxygenase domain-containing protein n=1 Tax=Aureobasidium pullulans TaxID=5580 RepID=A0A4V6TJ69_AURPU|nr:hypothetical protein D6D22_01914 [Aureobasidium pullulans]THZ77806.1 hypothetical protein D6C85_01435 [Aureobasidium pullulans]